MLWTSIQQGFPRSPHVHIKSDRLEQGQTHLCAIQKGGPPEWVPYTGRSFMVENKLKAAIDGFARDSIFRHHREDRRRRHVSMRDGPRSQIQGTAIGGKTAVSALKAPQTCIAAVTDIPSFGRQKQYREGGRVGI